MRWSIISIRRAFEELVCEKDYKDITVTELFERAMINKKTFYQYYPSLEDLLIDGGTIAAMRIGRYTLGGLSTILFPLL